MLGYGFLDEMAKVAGLGSWTKGVYQAQVGQKLKRIGHRLKHKGVGSAFIGGPMRDYGDLLKKTYKGELPLTILGGSAKKHREYQEARTRDVEQNERD